MNKKSIIIFISIIIVAILGSFLIYKNVNRENPEAKEIMKEHEKFSKEYKELNKDNVFVYRSVEDIKNILKEGTGIVYLGFPECPWCQRYVLYLNEVAKKEEIKNIYYYNILNDRKEDNNDYKDLVEILKDYLNKNDEGKPRIFVPEVIFVKKGKVMARDNETSMITDHNLTPDKYWTKEKEKALKEKLKKYIKLIKDDKVCTDCNK